MVCGAKHHILLPACLHLASSLSSTRTSKHFECTETIISDVSVYFDSNESGFALSVGAVVKALDHLLASFLKVN